MIYSVYPPVLLLKDISVTPCITNSPFDSLAPTSTRIPSSSSHHAGRTVRFLCDVYSVVALALIGSDEHPAGAARRRMVHTPLARCRYRCLCRSSVRCPLHPFPLLFLSLSFLSPSFSISFIHFLGQSQSVGVGKVQLHAAFLAAMAAALLLARQSPTRHALHRRPKEGMMLDTEELERKRRGGNERTNDCGTLGAVLESSSVRYIRRVLCIFSPFSI